MRKFTSSQRKIGPKQSSASGSFISRKQNNRIIQFESSLERDFILLSEFDSNVKTYIDQPIKIEYLDSNGRKRIYTPDFLVEYRNNQMQSNIIEIKYSSHLLKNFHLYEEKFYHARSYCKKNALTFSILTEKDIRNGQKTYLTNVSFLLKHRETIGRSQTSLHNEKDIKICLNLIKELRRKNKASITDLVETYRNKYITEQDPLYYIWFLISNNYISCDLKELLTKNSLIWVE